MYMSSDPVETGSYEFRVPAIFGVPIGSKYRAVLHACWENSCHSREGGNLACECGCSV
jgi:hypothetical protein